MSSVVIAGDVSGTVTLDAPSAAGSTVLTLPATSGTVLTTGTTVTAAQGGTGLTSPGTSGNILTSNGTAWTSAAPATSVTSLNGQTGAITNTNYDAIGSYTAAFGVANTAYSFGSTIAGSNLVWGGNGTTFGGFSQVMASQSNFQANLFTQTPPGNSGSMSASGTWRCMTYGGGTPSAGVRQFHLWVRIS
jgi:hypothetical protein